MLLARPVSAHALLPARTLFMWAALVAYFLASLDLLNPKPDTLVSIFMILTVAALFRALTTNKLLVWLAVGLCGGLAFWAKAFAFPFFLMLIFFTALGHLRKVRVLGRLALALIVFALVAAPLLWQISTLRGRFTYGEAGRLDMAWYVNRADRFNPVGDRAAWNPRSAIANLKHPGELLSQSPSIAYYGGPNSFGSTPQWTDLSYWSDGLAPRFVPRESLRQIVHSLSVLSATVAMRFQILCLVALLGLWGFRMRGKSFCQPIVLVALVQAIACIGLYSVVYVEPRYIAFAFVLIATVYAASSMTSMPVREDLSVHGAVLIGAALVLVFGIQTTLREGKEARLQGAQPAHGIYSLAIDSAGAQLASLYPRGAEVACMGDAACWTDPYWARFAGLRMTAIIETGHGFKEESAEQGCPKLAQNPAALDALRSKNVRAIVARFDKTQPCSAAWRPLGKSPNFFYLPL